MDVYAVASLSGDARLGAAVAEKYPGNYTVPAANLWLVSGTDATTREVCDKLEASTGERGQVFVLKCDAYWGFGPPDLWEWIKAKKAAG